MECGKRSEGKTTRKVFISHRVHRISNVSIIISSSRQLLHFFYHLSGELRSTLDRLNMRKHQVALWQISVQFGHFHYLDERYVLPKQRDLLLSQIVK